MPVATWELCSKFISRNPKTPVILTSKRRAFVEGTSTTYLYVWGTTKFLNKWDSILIEVTALGPSNQIMALNSDNCILNLLQQFGDVHFSKTFPFYFDKSTIQIDNFHLYPYSKTLSFHAQTVTQLCFYHTINWGEKLSFRVFKNIWGLTVIGDR